MTRLSRLWPFVLKSTHGALQTENWTLRDALKSANEELAKHRRLIGALRDGDPATTRQLEAVFAKGPKSGSAR